MDATFLAEVRAAADTDPLRALSARWWESFGESDYDAPQTFAPNGAPMPPPPRLRDGTAPFALGDLGAFGFETLAGAEHRHMPGHEWTGDGRRWRRYGQWAAYSWHDRPLTPPEWYLSESRGRLARVRAQDDHSVLAIIAADAILSVTEYGTDGLSQLPAYVGPDCPDLPDADADKLTDRKAETVLRAGDVREAWPSFRRAWRAFAALSGDPNPAVVLSRRQAAPWFGLHERKAVAFVDWLAREGVLEEGEGEPLVAPGGLEIVPRTYRLADVARVPDW